MARWHAQCHTANQSPVELGQGPDPHSAQPLLPSLPPVDTPGGGACTALECGSLHGDQEEVTVTMQDPASAPSQCGLHCPCREPGQPRLAGGKPWAGWVQMLTDKQLAWFAISNYAQKNIGKESTAESSIPGCSDSQVLLVLVDLELMCSYWESH